MWFSETGYSLSVTMAGGLILRFGWRAGAGSREGVPMRDQLDRDAAGGEFSRGRTGLC